MYVCTYTCVHTYVHTYFYVCMPYTCVHLYIRTYVLQCICICEVVLYVRNCMNVQYVLSYMHCVGKYFPSEMGYSVEFSPLWERVHHPMFLPCTYMFLCMAFTQTVQHLSQAGDTEQWGHSSTAVLFCPRCGHGCPEGQVGLQGEHSGGCPLRWHVC